MDAANFNHAPKPAAATFEAGKTYWTRSIGDSGCIIRATIAKRTAKTVTTTDGKRFRVRPDYDGSETFMPWGRYSMAPRISADRVLS